jgi:hypothetical protein
MSRPSAVVRWVRSSLLRFFAAPVDARAAALLRLSIGAVALWQCVGIWLNLDRYWGPLGFVPYKLVANDRMFWLTALAWAPESTVWPSVVASLFTASAVLFFVGFRARIFGLLLAYLHLSFQARNPFILNSGDSLFMIQLVLSSVAPLSGRWSVDAWLARRRGRSLAPGTVWGQRLVGLQIAYVYLNSTLAKLTNERWQDGMAMRDVLASPVFAEWPTYVDSRALVMLLTYSALVYEGVFPFVVWFRRLRPWFLAWGVIFHVSIDLTMVIPIFSAIMIASFPAFMTDEEVRTVFGLRGRSARRALRRGS